MQNFSTLCLMLEMAKEGKKSEKKEFHGIYTCLKYGEDSTELPIFHLQNYRSFIQFTCLNRDHFFFDILFLIPCFDILFITQNELSSH